jgi:uncharacterized protein
MPKKRVIIVHAWDCTPTQGWYPWLKKELEANGFEVHVPELPETEKPQIHTWVPKLAAVVGTADEHTYFVGHSMGCQTIARYLESLPDGVRVGGAVFVAGFFKRLTNMEDAEVAAIARPWFETPLDLTVVQSHLPKSVAIFSDDDPYVPLDNQDDFRDQLGSKIIIQKQQGHFSESVGGTTELPIALESLLGML